MAQREKEADVYFKMWAIFVLSTTMTDITSASGPELLALLLNPCPHWMR
jgi:hypothetical protein